MRTNALVNRGTVLSPGDDVLYEVVDDQVVALALGGAYEVWIATEMVARLATFARERRRRLAVAVAVCSRGAGAPRYGLS